MSALMRATPAPAVIDALRRAADHLDRAGATGAFTPDGVARLVLLRDAVSTGKAPPQRQLHDSHVQRRAPRVALARSHEQVGRAVAALEVAKASADRARWPRLHALYRRVRVSMFALEPPWVLATPDVDRLVRLVPHSGVVQPEDPDIWLRALRAVGELDIAVG